MTVQQRLASNDRFQSVLRTALADGQLLVCSQECERWNHPAGGVDKLDQPKPDGTYDVEGHMCTDVTAPWRLRWWHPHDLWSRFSAVAGWLSDTWDLYPPRRLFRDFKSFLGWVRDTNPLRSTYSGWVWTLDSLAAVAYEAEMDKASEIVEQRRPPLCGMPRAREVAKLAQTLRGTLTRDEVLAYMADDGMEQILDWMWVNREDPTVFVVDQAHVPFDLKDGWSNLEVARIIGLWMHHVAKVHLLPWKLAQSL